MKQYLLYIFFTLMLVACSEKEQVAINKGSIYLQPYDSFTQHEAVKLKKELDFHFQEILADSFVVEVFPNKSLTKDLLNDAQTRYKGERMISSLKDSPSTTIALTHKDISIEYNGKKDWGVLGVSFRRTPPCNACAVSDYRLKNKKRDFWKVEVHEFIHTQKNHGDRYLISCYTNTSKEVVMKNKDKHNNESESIIG